MPVGVDPTDPADSGGGTPSTGHGDASVSLSGSKLTIGGVLVDRAAARLRLTQVEPCPRGGVPRLSFAVRGRGYSALPDPYIGKEVALTLNFNDGAGDVQVFKGDCHGYSASWSKIGYIHEYTCTGLRDRADRIPVFDDNTGANEMTFNAEPGPDYRASRAGRNVGQMVMDVLSQEATVAALAAAGIGNFAGVGSGAAATAVLSGRSVGSIVVDLPGSGYSTGNRVTVALVGGGGTGAVAGNYTVSGGGIATIPVASGGSGYLTPPIVVFSKLPPLTLADLGGLDTVPQHPVTIAGEKLFSAIEGALEDRNPNFWVHIEATDGTIRFFDQRRFGDTTATVAGGSPTRAAIVAPVVVGGAIVALDILDGGAGYSSPSITFADPVGSGASYTLSATSGSITGWTKVSGGGGYGGGRAKLRVDGRPSSGPESFSVGRDTRGCFPRLQAIGAPSAPAKRFRLKDGGIVEAFAYGGLSNAKAKQYWKDDDFASPREVGSKALAVATRNGSVVQSISVSNSGFGYNYASPPSVAITPKPGSGATFQVNFNPGTGAITSVNVLSGGSGYDGPTPTFSVFGGGGSGATFSVSRSAGVITAVAVTAGGSGYTYAPTGIVSGLGSGSGATAHAVVDLGAAGGDGNVTSIVLDTPGSGYATSPVVTVAGHGGAASRSTGTASCLTTLTVRVTSSDPSETWPANYWDQSASGIHGTVLLEYNGGVATVQSGALTVVANTALTAGGTSDLTLESSVPLDTLAYVNYELVGDATPASRVWRAYQVADPVDRKRLRAEFASPIAVGNADGTQLIRKTHAFAKVIYSAGGLGKTREREWGFDFDPDTGIILFHQPVVRAFGTKANLSAGGFATDGQPDDVEVWIGVRGNSQVVTLPADSGSTPQYEGTSYSVDGVQRTKVLHFPQWRDPSGRAEILKIARSYLDSIKDAVIEGGVGLDSAHRAFFHPGLALDFAAVDGTDLGLGSAKAPVVGSVLRWSSDGAEYHTMGLQVSTRRAHYSGPDMPRPGQTARDRDSAPAVLGGQAQSGGMQGGANWGTQAAAGMQGFGDPASGANSAMAGMTGGANEFMSQTRKQFRRIDE